MVGTIVNLNGGTGNGSEAHAGALGMEPLRK